MSSKAPSHATTQLKTLYPDPKATLGEHSRSLHVMLTSLGKTAKKMSIINHKFDGIEEKIDRHKERLRMYCDSLGAETVEAQYLAKVDGSHNPADIIESSKLKAEEEDEPDSLLRDYTSKNPNLPEDLDLLRQHVKEEPERANILTFLAELDEKQEQFQKLSATLQCLNSEISALWSSLCPTAEPLGQDPAKFDMSQFDNQFGAHGTAYDQQHSISIPADFAERFCKSYEVMLKLINGVTSLNSETE